MEVAVVAEAVVVVAEDTPPEHADQLSPTFKVFDCYILVVSIF